MKKVANAARFLRNNGMSGFTKECYYRLLDTFYESYFHVHTRGRVGKDDLGITDGDARHYSSIFYRHTMDMLDAIPIPRDESTLLDYGCGKGRVLVVAAARRYRAIIGVEISSLFDTCKNNLDRMKHRKTSQVTILRADAREFVVPDDVNIIYFYNPFMGATLEDATRNIHKSYLQTPRKIYIIYFKNDHFDEIVASCDWLTKTRQSTLYPDLACGLYETRV